MNINDLRVIDSATGEPRPLTNDELTYVFTNGSHQVDQESMQLLAAIVMWLADSGYGTQFTTHRPPPIPLATLAKAYNALDKSKTPDEWQQEIIRFTVAAVPGLAERVARNEARREFGSDYE